LKRKKHQIFTIGSSRNESRNFWLNLLAQMIASLATWHNWKEYPEFRAFGVQI
jgi:hypothetical protein